MYFCFFDNAMQNLIKIGRAKIISAAYFYEKSPKKCFEDHIYRYDNHTR